MCLLLGAASIWLLRQPDWKRQISVATKKLLLSPEQAAEQSKLRRALIEYPESYFEVEQLPRMQTQAAIKERFYSVLATGLVSTRNPHNKLPNFGESRKARPRSLYL